MENNPIKRTRKEGSLNEPLQTNAQLSGPVLQAYSELLSRMSLAKQLGLSHGGARNLYDSLGYPENVNIADFKLRYKRQDMAKAIIKRPSKATWSGDIIVTEPNTEDTTALETAWQDLDAEHGIKSKLARLDRLTSLGTYGVLLLGLSDVTGPADMAQPVTGKTLKLLYLKPLAEDSATIATWEEDPSNKRYGMPSSYSIKVGRGNVIQTLTVHWSRVIHVAWDLMEDEVSGTPVLEAVYNRLMDLEKLVGGSAEMFWRNARPGWNAEVDKEYTLPPDEEKKFSEQVSEYENNLRRIFTTTGVKMNPMSANVHDPTSHVSVQIDMISAETGIPKRILLGSERGELASSQDQNAWSDYIDTRRTEVIEPCLLRPLVDRFIEYGILPKASTKAGYIVKWESLYTTSEETRVKIGKDRASAVKEYASIPGATNILPPEAFMELCLGLDKDQITLVLKQVEAMANEVKDLTPEEVASLQEEEADAQQQQQQQQQQQIKKKQPKNEEA